MIFPTKGIVLSTIPYKENSIIARIFTEKFGFQSYIVQSVRSAKSKNKIALFQPLTLLDLMVYHKENRDLHHISELSCEMPFHDIPFSIYKTSVAWVLAEIIQKCIPLHEDEQLFTFLHDSIVIFDNLKENN